ncbi:hypothetical protein KZZ52_41925 [Dactylosporangium sp. AC04546]|uniref:hypothetical protein n=1 Tax=Dactylosporangium sp. AC04546 TaxID=2862460 RepID=UPI001EDCCD45|nr:hypothetical protein [Dactylosporangium sp. AC04546]WVK80485.1 hypothetical protein KZZ52_41925 [Dactylosporangium sp. AC04546]
MSGGTEDARAAAGMLDDGQDVQSGPGQGDGLEEVGCEGSVTVQLPFKDRDLVSEGEDLCVLVPIAH